MDLRLALCALPALWAVQGAVAQPPAPELRGLWLQTAAISTPEKADAAVARAVQAHLNALFPLVWCAGGIAYYKTDLAPLSDKVAPDYDPLGYLVKRAHEHGLQVHPWFLNVCSGKTEPGVLLQKHPDWALQGTLRGREPWYDLGKPEVREYQTALMVDCLRRYDLDGLHFDTIRYGSQQYCYCDHCQREFAQRSGLPPLTRDDAHFPVRLTLVGTALNEPTTTQVLATFEDGAAAVTLNRLGQGEAAVINWQLPRYHSAALDDAAQRLLRHLGVTGPEVLVLSTSTSLKRYGAESQSRVVSWLEGLGYKPRRLDEQGLPQVPAEGTLVLYAQYVLSPETAEWLKQFVSSGGHCLFLDAPSEAIKLPALQAVVGFRSCGRYFNRLRLVVPTADQTLLPTCPPVDLAFERERIRQWVAYRMDTVTQLVAAVYREAKAVKPQAQITAAVFFTKEEADAVCQDWYTWLKQGILDYAIPMAYVLDNDVLETALKEWQQADPTLARIVPGLGIWMSRDGRDVARPGTVVNDQIKLCRRYGAHGEVLFVYSVLNADLANALATGTYEPAVAPYAPAPRAQ